MGNALLRWLGISDEIGKPIGRYKQVGRVRFDVDGVQGHLFFPLQVDFKINRYLQESYMRKNAIKGLSESLRVSLMFLSLTTGSVKHYFATEENLENKQPLILEKLPLVIFSHGIFGTSETYSKTCGDIASNGAIVFAVEHTDGSASYAVKNGAIMHYNHPPKHLSYNRANVQSFRAPQLATRISEINLVLEFLDRGNFNDLSTTHQHIFERLDMKKIFLAGHSFGAASTTHIGYRFEHDGVFAEQIRGYILLDIWPLPLEQEILDTGLKKPLISIRGESFASNDESTLTNTLCVVSNNRLNVYMKGVTHQQFSDGPWHTRLGFLRRKLETEGDTPRSKSQDAFISAIHDFMNDPNGFNKDKLSNPIAQNLLLPVLT